MKKRFDVREATGDDADSIADIFRTVYREYQYGAYTNPDRVRDSLLPDAQTHIFVVEIRAGERIDGERIARPKVVGTGSVSFSADGRIATLAAAAIYPDFQGLEHNGVSAYEALLDTRYRHARDEDASFVQTEANSSAHAITQHEFDKRGFVPVGVLQSRYPEAFAECGRETVVLMVDSESRFDDAEPGSRTVHLPPAATPLVERVLSAVNERRDRDPLERDIREVHTDGRSGPEKCTFAVECTSTSPQNGAVECEIRSGGDVDGSAVLRQLRARTAARRTQHLVVDIDVNEASGGKVSEYLLRNGFELAAFVPGSLQSREGAWHDRLSLQWGDHPLTNGQLIADAVDLVETLGLEYEVVERDAPVEGVVTVRI